MSLRKSLPSPTALFMFEASARHLSFTRAANDFNVTQSAVSRMIKRLEIHLGTILFRRGPTGLELTGEGFELFKAVSLGFRTIEAGFDDLRARQGNAHVVTLSLSSAFAMQWFVPMVDRFRETFPEIDLRLQIVKGEPVGPFEEVDLAIRYNDDDACNEIDRKIGVVRVHGAILSAKFRDQLRFGRLGDDSGKCQQQERDQHEECTGYMGILPSCPQ
jgi:DNA-binding transcriptional LysR family regulator